jgi:hypothetical protein
MTGRLPRDDTRASALRTSPGALSRARAMRSTRVTACQRVVPLGLEVASREAVGREREL